ncbi:MAG: DUF721 domain-containing protein [Pyrinomonadaceae bacterium]
MEQVFSSIGIAISTLEPNAAAEKAMAFAAWDRCAGELLRLRTRPTDFVGGRLVVAVENETWQRHLRELAPQMLSRLNNGLGGIKIRLIDFQVDSSISRNTDSEIRPARDVNENYSNVVESVSKAAELIEDRDLRLRFLEAAATCFRHTASK